MKQHFEGPLYADAPMSKDQPPPSTHIADPDGLFNELFAGTYSPGLIARMHNITLDALLAFASSPQTRARFEAFRQLALDRAELLAAEARLAAASSLLQHCHENPTSDRARKAASVVFRTSHRPPAPPPVCAPAAPEVPARPAASTSDRTSPRPTPRSLSQRAGTSLSKGRLPRAAPTAPTPVDPDNRPPSPVSRGAPDGPHPPSGHSRNGR